MTASNDMDVRQLINVTLHFAADEERKKLKKRVVLADTLIKKSLQPAKECLRGRDQTPRVDRPKELVVLSFPRTAGSRAPR